MKLSQYVLKEKLLDKTLLFNTINGVIVEIESDNISNDRVINLTSKNLDFLRKNLFFITKDKALKNFYDYKYESEAFHLIISLTEACNFKCSYCYENDFESKSVITEETLNCIYRYVHNNIINIKNLNYLIVDFIGGEPLIAKDRLKYIVSKLDSIKNLEILYSIETNGSLIDKDLLEFFSGRNVSFSVTLSSRKDHNNHRQYKNGNKSYDIIVSNINRLEEYFLKENINLTIRYNTHNENIDDFDMFYKSFKSEIKSRARLEIAYINNYTFNSFKNELDVKKYYNWLTRLSFKYPDLNLIDDNILNRVAHNGCFAYQGYGLKIYSDGALGLCNAYDYKNRKGNIKNMMNIQDFNALFFDLINKKNNRLPKECEECKYVFLCGGPRYCRLDEQCDFIECDINEYLKGLAT